MIVIDSSVGPMSFLSMDSWKHLQFQKTVSSFAFKSNPKGLGFSHNIHDTVTLMNISLHGFCYCSSQGSHMGKSVHVFSLLTVCKIPSGRKASQEGERFLLMLTIIVHGL